MKNRLFSTAAFLLLFGSLSAQTEFDLSKPLAGRLQHLGRTQALRDLPEIRRDTGPPLPVREVPNFIEAADTAVRVSVPGQPDPVRQNAPGHQAAPALLLNIDGLNMAQTGPVNPPDPTGEAGLDHYIQLTNGHDGCVALIIDKTGVVKKGAFELNVLWQDIGQTGLGDGIVLYDQLHQRWLLTEFSDHTNKLLLAVSVTTDPLGDWEVYALSTPNFPDYPKYALWGDALVISTNEPGKFIPVYGVNRQDLFTLQPAPRVQRLSSIPKASIQLQVLAPVDVDGLVEPPAGSAPLVLRMVDNDISGDRVELFALHFDWDSVQHSGIGPAESIPLDAFSIPLCYFGCMTIPGWGGINSIPGVPMNRATYRNFGVYESLLFNFTIETGDGRNTIRWVELRRTTADGAWALYQESTYAPDSGQRWMGSLAQDKAGNMALGYSVANSLVRGALRFTGRMPGDPAGWLSLAETELAGGTTSPYLSIRWGDYFNMTVDPVDDKTFWFTGEYLKKPSIPDWGTRIVAFQLRRDTHDLGPVALIAPVDSSTGAAETVRIQVHNFGLSPESDFTVGYILDDQPPVIEMLNITLAPDSSYEHQFSTPADLSGFGVYRFVLFTSLAGDQSIPNDTLRVPIRHYTLHDAGPGALHGLDPPLCPDTVVASVPIINHGTEFLESVELFWQVDTGPTEQQHVDVMLPPGASVEVNIPIPVSYGDKQLNVFTALPNGLPDEGPGNDTVRYPLQVIDGEFIRIELTTDLAPKGIFWCFDGPGGQYIECLEGQLSLPQHTYVYSWCVQPDSCYQFILISSGAHGLSTGTPPGDLKIYRANGDLIYQLPNPDFGEYLKVDICPNLDCSGLRALAETHLPSDWNGEGGKIILHATGGVPPYLYSFDNQLNYIPDSIQTHTGLFQGLVFVKDATGCVFGVYLEMQDCLMFVELNLTPTAPDTATGELRLAVSNGKPPLTYSLDGGPAQTQAVFTGLTAGYHLVCVQNALDCVECYVFAIGVASGSGPGPASDSWFRAVPNPAGDFFRIEAGGFSGAESLPYRLYDGTGRLMRQGDLTRWGDTLVAPVDARGLPAGIYTVWVLGMKTILRVAVE